MQIKNELRNIVRDISYNNIKIKDIRSIDIDISNIYFFNLSSNPIKILSIQDSFFYFRECRKHKDFKSFVLESLNKFYHIAVHPVKNDNFEQIVPIRQFFSADYVAEFKQYIDACICKYDFIHKIKSLSIILEKVKFSIWEGNYIVSKENLNIIGLQDFPDKFQDILPLFLIYMRSGTTGWKGEKGSYECYNACRSIGSSKIAELLGAKSIYTSANLIRLKIGDIEEIGVLSNKAPGIRALDTKAAPTPSLQCQLSTLNIIDALCYQPDHWINNYNVVLDDNGKAVDVCAFDNDNGKTFSPFGGINISCYHGGGSFINKQGLIAMPHLDKNIAKRLLALSFKEVKKTLSPYLNTLQLFAIRYRLFLLKKYIKKTSVARHNFLLSPSEFNECTLADELSGKYGHTYLFQYAHGTSNLKE